MESTPRAYRLKAGNAASPISTFSGAIPCSGFTYVTASRIAQPPSADFVARLQPARSPRQTACQLPDQTDYYLGDTFLHWCSAPSGRTEISGLVWPPALPTRSPMKCTVKRRGAIMRRAALISSTLMFRWWHLFRGQLQSFRVLLPQGLIPGHAQALEVISNQLKEGSRISGCLRYRLYFGLRACLASFRNA